MNFPFSFHLTSSVSMKSGETAVCWGLESMSLCVSPAMWSVNAQCLWSESELCIVSIYGFHPAAGASKCARAPCKWGPDFPQPSCQSHWPTKQPRVLVLPFWHPRPGLLNTWLKILTTCVTVSLFCIPSRGHGSQPDGFYSIVTQFCGDFCNSLGGTGVFLTVLFRF